jgi:hypothetical protein
MASKKDKYLVQSILAFARGCGTAQVDDDACGWFHDRYDSWVTKKKKVGTSPEDVWAKEGKNFLGKFEEIGKKAAAAAGGGTITEATLTSTATTVETDSDCPWCPVKPDP